MAEASRVAAMLDVLRVSFDPGEEDLLSAGYSDLLPA